MQLPFSDEQFFAVFAAYNSALWPFAAALWMLSIAAFLSVLRGRHSDRLVMVFLALQWAWTSIAYHWAYFAAINSAATTFAGVFLLQAGLLGVSAWRGSVRFSWRPTVQHFAGASLVVYSLAYPALAAFLVGVYPRIPTFGVPCPTTLLTVGFLLMTTRPALPLMIIPLLWAMVGGSAAFLFDVIPDFALIVAVLAVIVSTIAPLSIERSTDRAPRDSNERLR